MSPPPAAGVSSFQYLLEVTVVSAQDLHPASSSMRTYAKTYVDPKHRPRTRLDSTGHTEPSWNDKFVFRVDDTFILSDTSAVTVDVYASRRGLPDVHLGTARGLMSTLHPTQVTRYVALLVRRPKSLRPQGILNVGVSLLDPHTRSLPLHSHPHPAIAARNVAGGEKAKAAKAKSLDEGGPGRDAVVDKEREELEKKLEKWRQELRPLLMEPKDEKRVSVNVARDDLGGTRRLAKMTSIGRMSCFSIWNGESGKLAGAGSRPGPPPPPPTHIVEEKLMESALEHSYDDHAIQSSS